MTRRLLLLVPAGALVAALIVAARVPYPPLRNYSLGLVAALALVMVAARLAAGLPDGWTMTVLGAGGFTVLAGEALSTVEQMRTEPHPESVTRAGLVVWVGLLSVQVLTIAVLTGSRLRIPVRALGTGATYGLVGFGLWALVCLMAKDVPSTAVPAVLAAVLAGLGAIQWSSRGATAGPGPALAGLLAATTVALLSAVYIDAVLPAFGAWVGNSDPPISAAGPLAPHRLVDPVGLLMLGTLLAMALTVTAIAVGRRRAEAGAPASAATAAA